MKTWRLLLGLLLAVLLPLRGAWAVAMPCGWPAPADLQTALVTPQAAPQLATAAPAPHCAEMAALMGHDGAHDDADLAAPDSAGPDAPSSSPGACHACGAACSLMPLATALPDCPAPALSGRLRFAQPQVSIEPFSASGPDRPPRRPA